MRGLRVPDAAAASGPDRRPPSTAAAADTDNGGAQTYSLAPQNILTPAGEYAFAHARRRPSASGAAAQPAEEMTEDAHRLDASTGDQNGVRAEGESNAGGQRDQDGTRNQALPNPTRGAAWLRYKRVLQTTVELLCLSSTIGLLLLLVALHTHTISHSSCIPQQSRSASPASEVIEIRIVGVWSRLSEQLRAELMTQLASHQHHDSHAQSAQAKALHRRHRWDGTAGPAAATATSGSSGAVARAVLRAYLCDFWHALVCLLMCLSLFVSLYVCLSMCLSIYRSVCPSRLRACIYRYRLSMRHTQTQTRTRTCTQA